MSITLEQRLFARIEALREALMDVQECPVQGGELHIAGNALLIDSEQATLCSAEKTGSVVSETSVTVIDLVDQLLDAAHEYEIAVGTFRTDRARGEFHDARQRLLDAIGASAHSSTERPPTEIVEGSQS